MTAARSHPFTPLEDFLEMDAPEAGWREWCAGFVYAMSGGTPEHSRLGSRMNTFLARIAGDACTVFDANADLWVHAAAFYGRADASLVCGALHTYAVKKGSRVLGEAITNPVLIVEILSPSTETRDRGEKFEAYKQIATLEEYVLVSSETRCIEVRRRSGPGWSADVALSGGRVTLRGHELDVDAFYGG